MHWLVVCLLIAIVASSCDLNVGELAQCISYKIEAANAWDCATSKAAACECASCFVSAGLPCGDVDWDSHYADCVVDCGTQCYTSQLSPSLDTLPPIPIIAILSSLAFTILVLAVIYIVCRYCCDPVPPRIDL